MGLIKTTAMHDFEYTPSVPPRFHPSRPLLVRSSLPPSLPSLLPPSLLPSLPVCTREKFQLFVNSDRRLSVKQLEGTSPFDHWQKVKRLPARATLSLLITLSPPETAG